MATMFSNSSKEGPCGPRWKLNQIHNNNTKSNRQVRPRGAAPIQSRGPPQTGDWQNNVELRIFTQKQAKQADFLGVPVFDYSYIGYSDIEIQKILNGQQVGRVVIKHEV